MGSRRFRQTTVSATGRTVLLAGCLAAVSAVPSARAQPGATPVRQAWQAGDYFPPSLGPWPAERVTPLLEAVDPARLRAWHDLLASEPHVAGTPGDLRQVDRIAGAFAEMGLEVEKHEFWAYLARPVSAVLELVTSSGAGEIQRTKLVLKERILPEDADSGTPDLSWGWNAYSGNGDVTAGIVYANQGTKADFAKLRELGVDVRGKVVLCRYGGNFRGYKVRFAEAAGPAAVVIFVDGGADAASGYPDGGAPNDTCIERGSINTLDYPGDPLTPGREATEDAERLDSDAVGLPRIPVQPIGWGAAREILLRMAEADVSGASPPLPEGWQARLPVPCTVVGGDGVRLRVVVEQAREITRTANVIGTLPGHSPGSRDAERWVLVGSHHDAWGFGACDPACGTIVTMEAARVFAEAARAGRPPRRTMKFCAWGAEEFSIIGSTEWVEGRLGKLERDGVAYINLDMSVMGPNFGSSSAPTLKTLITGVTRHVPAIGARFDPTTAGGIIGPSVFDTWISRETDPRLPGQPKFGDLGGGSDHVGFWCLAGVPSCSVGSSGARGSAYHSVYDTLTWYRRNVGDDYLPAQMVTRVVVGMLARLAGDEVVPLEPAGRRNWFDAAGHAAALRDGVARLDPELGSRVDALHDAFMRNARIETNPVPAPSAESQTALRMAEARRWVQPGCMPGRPWYANLLMSPDADSGYASWPLPPLSLAIARGDAAAAADALEVYESLASAGLGGAPAAADAESQPPAPPAIRTGQ